uniref:RGS domain-containing protein n=2 Tax=Acrobeloides nanus TaxID=290746 RepID=A0A914E9M3_9BILA
MRPIDAKEKHHDLEKILKNDQTRASFKEFLQQQFCAENLNFYLAVEDFKKIPDADVQKRNRVGRQIFERHFTPNSPESVNIDNAASKAIREKVRQGLFTPDLYDAAQYQIFHLLKYDCWPRYLRSGGQYEELCSEGPSSSKANHRAGTMSSGDSAANSPTSSIQYGESGRPKPLRQSVNEGQCRFCMLLSADSLSSEREALNDPLISVKRWTEIVAEKRGMDKVNTEVVDAQTGSTIDPARQAIDALNNRHVRLMPVVKFPIEFLAPTTSSKCSVPPLIKAVVLRVRQGLTLNKVLKPLLSKYNIDADQLAVCFAGTCDPVPLGTTVANIQPRTVIVMTPQQFQDRKLLSKRDYQKEINATANLLNSEQEHSLPFHQHGDIAFYEVPLETEGKGLKLNATRSHSTNPRELFKFGRKASQAKGHRGDHEVVGPSHPETQIKKAGSIRRKSIGTQNRSGSIAPASIAPSDIPYCGDNLEETILSEVNAAQNKDFMPCRIDASKPTTMLENSNINMDRCYETEYIKGEQSQPNEKCAKTESGVNGSTPLLPPIYASAIRSEEALSPTDSDRGMSWHAEYV